MESVLSTEGSLALAISILAIVLGYRFSLPERGRDFAGVAGYVLAIAVTFVSAHWFARAARATDLGPAWRYAGDASLVIGLLLAGSSFRARLVAGRGRLAATGPYARIRHPLYLGLGLALLGQLLRLPSAAGLVCTLLALGGYLWAGAAEERDAAAAFGAEWRAYAQRTGAILPRLRGARANPG